MTETILKLIAALAPAVVLGFVLVRKDRRPEPLGWLLAAVGLGVLVGPAVMALAYLGLPDFPIDTFEGALLSSFVSAAIPEEGLKFVALYLLASRCRHFDEVFDGVVYAVCIGMGFAGIENVMYLFGDENWVIMSISRALLAVPMHYFFAVIMGAFFALGWFDRRNRTAYMTAALLVPIAVHGIYDTLCFSIDIDDGLSGLVLLLFILFFRHIRRYVRNLVNSMLKLDEYGSCAQNTH
ncbi:MAG: PrsW family intramembrane metalloprotease [Duncaniella sp.]|nr:PrsW family intramembrane metalloprotease [Duncaniella sp.]